eukprot:20957-Heterococcus_DN1.PRE.5
MLSEQQLSTLLQRQYAQQHAAEQQGQMPTTFRRLMRPHSHWLVCQCCATAAATVSTTAACQWYEVA